MRIRDTVILLVVFALLGTGYYVSTRPTPATGTSRIYLYDLNSDDVESIELRQGERTLKLQKQDKTWQMVAPQSAEADQGRVNGAVLALSAVVADRVIAEKAEDLALYGLASPQIQATIGVKGGGGATLLLGERNPVANQYYAQRRGKETVFLVDSSWAEVILGLLNQLPIATPTPTPTPTPAPATTPTLTP